MIRPGPKSEAGFSVVLVVFSILILLTLGIAMVSMVVEDSDLSVMQVNENKAFYAAHAGIEYAIVKLSANWNWGGLPSPGKNVGAGYFWIAPPDGVDETGAALPAGRKRIISTGVVGTTTRSIQVHLNGSTISTYAGTGTAGYTGDGGAATAAQESGAQGVAVAANGDVYIADTGNHVIRKIAFSTGIITKVAGNNGANCNGNCGNGYSGDGGQATVAQLDSPEDVFVAANGDLYIADTANNAIRKVSAATGIITTVAGTGTAGATGDGGAATAARLSSPRGIVLASNGDMYIADRSNNKIRKVTAATGIITTFAGTGTAGYQGDGAAATAARLTSPEGVAIMPNGDVYVADTGNNVVRKITAATGVITTFAGTGTAGSTGDGGAATAARLNAPQALDVTSGGDVYIADTGSNEIRRVQSGTGIISTIAGTGTAGFSGDGGLATAAQLSSPRGIGIASTGTYYIGGSGNNRIRRVNGTFAVVAWVETRT